MKITAIRPIFAQGERRTFVFIKVETDQQGLVGWGEASVEGKPRAVAGCVQDMEPMPCSRDGPMSMASARAAKPVSARRSPS